MEGTDGVGNIQLVGRFQVHDTHSGWRLNIGYRPSEPSSTNSEEVERQTEIVHTLKATALQFGR